MTLERFVEAQDRIWPEPVQELRGGRKRSHWMWFVFPQLRGLGRSDMAQFYGLNGLGEAQAYLEHPILRARLDEATAAMLTQAGARPEDVLGATDALKLRSSATIFARAGFTPADDILRVFYAGPDPETLRLIGKPT
ncbi:DUF1810 domain-containing protein [Falsirhodobacter sp. 20TX0035]|uniref:DUF1810 domain-containing protein n=1 Tax=Falsirhodobacter sp. 20TX0035 TaxID=3022019 RepID=UPI00232F5708|nr:DUF1810 domain-containing protein [Falsirhodobacter sp. 20TX0035]MDB6452944.1 DUF1810 domain-containing protein [Falsirhodobacter sp. 20TX0035]